MPVTASPLYLLASNEHAILAALETLLTREGGRVKKSMSANSALKSMTAHKLPTLAIIDDALPGMPLPQLLATVLSMPCGKRFPIVVMSDAVMREWAERLHEGVIDDILPRNADPSWWGIRIDLVLRAHRLSVELDSLRESTMAGAQLDRLTGAYNREGLLAILFRETDRVLRQKNSLCTLLFDIDDFGHWNSRLGAEACDDLLRQVVSRTTRMLRSYDALGRLGKDEFFIVLPGCGTNNALMLAERLRLEVFGVPFRIGRESIRLSACFGIATSLGRSPGVVLRGGAGRCACPANRSGDDPVFRRIASARSTTRHVSLSKLRRRPAGLIAHLSQLFAAQIQFSFSCVLSTGAVSPPRILFVFAKRT